MNLSMQIIYIKKIRFLENVENKKTHVSNKNN